MEPKDYLQDLTEIKSIMNRSTRFFSLSGLSGVLAGIYALIGAHFANDLLLHQYGGIPNAKRVASSTFEAYLLGIALLVLSASIVTGFILTWRNAKKNQESLWNPSAKLLLINFFVPLFFGGIFTLGLLYQGYFILVPACTLIFYGLALFNASKYTFDTIKYLAITEMLLGIVSLFYLGKGLYFWAFGFGVCHIFYGFMMYFKYNRK